MCACYNTWKDNAKEQKRLRVVCTRVMKRMTQRTLCACYNTWKDNVAEQLRLKVVCQRVGARWLKAGLVATMNKWQTYVAQRQQDKNIVRRWLVAVENREISSAWRSWVAYVQFAIAQQHLNELNSLQHELNALRVAKKKQEDALCRRVLLKMLNVKICSAWSTWVEDVRLKALLERVGARWLKQSMLRCLNSWKDYTTESLRLKNVCKRVAARWHAAGLVRVLSKWKHHVLQRKADRVVVQRWLVSIKNREICAGWRTWLLFVRAAKDKDHLSVLQEQAEATNVERIKQATHHETEIIREKMTQLREELVDRNKLVIGLRQQLESQKKVSGQIVKLQRAVATTKHQYNAVQTELQHTLENHDLQVKELRGETGTLTRQLETVHQKSTTQLLQAKNNWENENARLHSKITRAKSLLKARAVSIRELEDHVQEKNQQLSLNKKAISLLQKEKKKLKFNLKELIVDQGVQVNKIQRRKDNIALAKQQEEKDKIIKLDALEALVGRELTTLNLHLDECAAAVSGMRHEKQYFLVRSPTK
jgi:hypothetical protein